MDIQLPRSNKRKIIRDDESDCDENPAKRLNSSSESNESAAKDIQIRINDANKHVIRDIHSDNVI